MRARALVVIVLLLSYGAVGARQPAVRMSVALPAPAEQIANALDILAVDRSRFVLDIVRTLFTVGLEVGDVRQRENLRVALLAAPASSGATVPLPLDASIWRETLLQRQVPDNQIVAAVLSDRSTSLLYHGLAGLDDETLAWLGPERETLRHLLRHAGAFAIFGPSVRVRAGRVAVPGGTEAEPLWQAIVGAEPARPAAFVRRLFGDESGHLAWFYDALASLDEPRLRFATSAALAGPARIERVRALLDVFEGNGNDWHPEKQPFSRRPFDPALTLGVMRVNADGTLVGPRQRGVWERVFADGAGPRAPSPGRERSDLDATPVDAAWLLARIHRVPIDVGRRRLEAFQFAQRAFAKFDGADPLVTSALRAHGSFPALVATLERAGVTAPGTITAAAARAQGITDTGDEQTRTLALTFFQATIGIIDRIVRSGSLSSADADGLVTRLATVDHGPRGYGGRIAAWIQRDLLTALPAVNDESVDASEDTLLAAMAGVRPTEKRTQVVEWEGRRYHVNAARGEELRLHRVRQRQGGASLLTALQSAQQTKKPGGERTLADTLTSILYAASLGDPDGPALAAGNIALRHDLGAGGVMGPRYSWRLPTEGHTAKGWRVSGSLLGLDVALARLSLRRLDSTDDAT